MSTFILGCLLFGIGIALFTTGIKDAFRRYKLILSTKIMLWSSVISLLISIVLIVIGALDIT